MNKKSVGRPRSYTRDQVRRAIETLLEAKGIHLRIAEGIDHEPVREILRAEFGITGQMREDTLQIEIDEALRELQSEQKERDRARLTAEQATKLKAASELIEEIQLSLVSFEREGFDARYTMLKRQAEEDLELHRHKLRETLELLAEARDALSENQVRLADTEAKLSEEQCKSADLRLELARVSGQLEGMRAATAEIGRTADPARLVSELNLAR